MDNVSSLNYGKDCLQTQKKPMQIVLADNRSRPPDDKYMVHKGQARDWEQYNSPEFSQLRKKREIQPRDVIFVWKIIGGVIIIQRA